MIIIVLLVFLFVGNVQSSCRHGILCAQGVIILFAMIAFKKNEENGYVMNANNITALTVNFKTPDLIHDCLTSFRQYYPNIPYIVVDNGGCEQSIEILHKLQSNDSNLTIIENDKNIGHGLALNLGLLRITTRFVFLLDSDTKVERGGFLEKMLELFDDDNMLFAAGWLRHRRGSDKRC